MFGLDTPNAKGKRNLNRRVFLLGGIQLAIGGLISYRLVELQAWDTDDFQELAETNRIGFGLIPPERGLIVDRKGLLLAQNEQEYWVTFVPEETPQKRETLQKVSQIISLSDQEIEEILQKIDQKPSFIPILLKEKVTWDKITELSVNSPALPGIYSGFGSVRHYPQGNSLSHLIGYVGSPSSIEIEANTDFQSLLSYPNFKIGKVGIEKAFDLELRGRPGNNKFEVNSSGRKIKVLASNDSVSGKNIQLTLDAELQEYTQLVLGDEVASVFIMDLEKGDVLVSASKPTFDPNLLSGGISSSDYQAYLENIYSPFFNRPLSGQYAPGSTFKIITLLAALESGLIDEDFTFYCNGSYEIAGGVFHCWNPKGHGTVGVKKSLKESCDVFYYRLAEIIGIERIAEMARRFGFGSKPELPIPDLSSGLVPDHEWKMANIGQGWVVGDTMNAAIGQGFVLASTAQIGLMLARLITNKKVLPRIVISKDGKEERVPEWEPMGISEKNLNLVLEGLVAALNEQKGTAFDARTIDDNFLIAGKTGTSQVRRITAQEREVGVTRNIDLPWEQRDHAIYCCYGPVQKPRYVASLIVEHGGSGSRVAAPIGRELIMRTFYDALPPLRAYPAEIRSQIIEMRLNFGINPEPPKPSANSRA
ncbi:MAG: penicillin-binding protein 2 [Rhodobacteraceae bacterium]|nr:penicillin-binding protein 2 [Paracoccaceae bacterium]